MQLITKLITRDITEKKLEEALRISEQRLKAIEGGIDGIVLTDLKGNILMINKAALDLLGFEKNEVVGKNVFSFFAENSWIGALKAMKETLRNGFVKNIQLVCEAKDGTEVPVELDVNILRGAKDKPIGFVLVKMVRKYLLKSM